MKYEFDTWSQLREYIDKGLYERFKDGDEVIVNSQMWIEGPPITKLKVVITKPYHTHEPMTYTWIPLEEEQ